MQPGFEAQRNVVFNLVGCERVNALVSWASTLGVALDRDEISKFHERFKPLPIVSMALPMEAIPTISVNSYDGMRTAVLHLIEVHGLRKIAFIRGPESHPYAQERYHAYLDVLQTCSIPHDDLLITPPLDWGAGVEAMQLLMEERQLRPGIDFEAVVAVSDLLALAAMQTLQAKGLRVPEDVALMGFNDYNEGRFSTPPLSSVYLSFHEQGYRALETALRMQSGEKVPELVTLPTHLIVRQSCGCPSQSILQAAAGVISTPHADVRAPADQLREKLMSDPECGGKDNDLILRLVESLSSNLVSKNSHLFLSTLEQILQQETRTGGDLSSWQNLISDLRQKALPLTPLEMRCQYEDCFNQARVLISDVALRSQAYQQLVSNRQSERLREISQELITTFDIDGLVEVLAERLPGLDIPSCYLALYDNGLSTSPYSRLVMAYSDGVRTPVEGGGRQFATCQLVPPELPPQRRYSMVVEPLFFREEQIGFMFSRLYPGKEAFMKSCSPRSAAP